MMTTREAAAAMPQHVGAVATSTCRHHMDGSHGVDRAYGNCLTMPCRVTKKLCDTVMGQYSITLHTQRGISSQVFDNTDQC